MNVSGSFPVQPHSVVVHDAGRIFNNHSDASVTVLSALNVHDVENVLLTPVRLKRRRRQGKEIHQHVVQTEGVLAHKMIQLGEKIDFLR